MVKRTNAQTRARTHTHIQRGRRERERERERERSAKKEKTRKEHPSQRGKAVRTIDDEHGNETAFTLHFPGWHTLVGYGVIHRLG